MPYSIAIAGSTSHTVQCAAALQSDPRFSLAWVLTPVPKPIGRKQVVTKNPLNTFSEQHDLPTLLIEHKIDANLRSSIEALPRPDFLLVVDFGYLVPKWLLAHPKVAPLNIHPSLLPRWRGSSPGQFVLLYGEKESAVTLMVMGEGLDTGPLVHQEYFDVEPHWGQSEYYRYSFDLIGKVLGNKILDLAEGRLTPIPQPEYSPSPLARRFTKADGFVPWKVIQAAIIGMHAKDVVDTSNLLQETYAELKSWPRVIANASRALNPWPTLWTIIPTTKGEKRMQILEAHWDKTNDKLTLDKVKLEGQNEVRWKDIAAII